MALKTDIRGMVHVYPDYFVVGREKVREFAKAVKNAKNLVPAKYKLPDTSDLSADVKAQSNKFTFELKD